MAVESNTDTPRSPLETARGYLARSWSPIPIPPKSKKPTAIAWQKMRLAEADLLNHFTARSNIGVLLGEPSGWLIDIDLDHELAVQWADQFLPPTGSEFGRVGKPRSHRLYRVTAPVTTHKRMLPDKDRTMIVELRSTGAQTVFPGSTHPSGEAIKWYSDGEPADVDPAALQAAVDSLADWVVTLVDAGTAAPTEYDDRNDREVALAALAALKPSRADSYHEWVAVGMALHSVGADDEMLAVWDEWSRKSAKYQEGKGECAAKWRGFGKRQGVTLGTLIYFARQDGGQPAYDCNGKGKHPVANPAPVTSHRPSSADADHIEPAGAPWPDSLAEEAFHGVAGDIVRAIEPHSEADPVALLTQLLVGFGNLIHNGPHFVAESDWHAAKLFVCLVGISSKARKGTSWGRTSWVLGSVDREWAKERVRSGLSSGEGLIWQVRDPLFKKEPIREGGGKGKGRGQIVGYEEVESDPGVSDKRLLVLESELGGVLRVLKREQNTLSAIIRDAWDKDILRTLTKNSPAVSTGCHISIIGHITRDELRRHLTETDMASGLANRFLWLCSRRSKCLPEGGSLDAVEFAPLVSRLNAAAEFAQQCGELRRDDQARAIWAAVYPELSEGHPGLLGAATSRAEAQTMRLAMIYAILDCSHVIRAEHLMAGLAIWKYSEQSARHIFGAALGDPHADEILRALRAAGSDGQTRNDIREHFGRHLGAEEIGRALGVLTEGSLARSEKVPSAGGRPIERWFST